MDASWWVVVSAMLPKPWPREAVLFDLRWWAGQERATADRPSSKRIVRPGRPALAERWGWSDKLTRGVMAAEDEWRDPMAVQSRANDGPVEGQRRSSRGPTAEPSNADKSPKKSNDGPVEGQRRSNDGPVEGPTRDPLFTDHRSPNTAHPSARGLPHGDQKEDRGGHARATAPPTATGRVAALATPTTWDAVEAHPDGLLALPWDALGDAALLGALRYAGLSVQGLRLTKPEEMGKTSGLGGAKGHTLRARLAGWGLVVGDLVRTDPPPPPPPAPRELTREERIRQRDARIAAYRSAQQATGAKQ